MNVSFLNRCGQVSLICFKFSHELPSSHSWHQRKCAPLVLGVICSCHDLHDIFFCMGCRHVKRSVSIPVDCKSATKSGGCCGMSLSIASFLCFKKCLRWKRSYPQDAFLPMLDATDLTELREAVHAYLRRCFPTLERVHVFLRNPVTKETETEKETLPKIGVIWEAFYKSTLHIWPVTDRSDPVLQLLDLQSSDPHTVVFLPVSSKQRDLRLGIVVACTKAAGFSKEEEQILNILAKQVSVAYLALTQCDLAPVSNSDQLESLIRLCGELHDQEAVSLELKVNRYLQTQTKCKSAFLLLVVPDTQELIAQVVGNTTLAEEKRFPGLWSCFAEALDKKTPIFLEQIPKDRRKQIEDIVDMEVDSFLCVPVVQKGSNNLLALACLVNKDHRQKFSEVDIQIVEQCFKYTATVITSTLAFQNERKLKTQTQALLHVAKELFTRLGESARESTQTKGLSPLLFAVSRFISNFRVKHMDEDIVGLDEMKNKPLPVKEDTQKDSIFRQPHCEEEISPQEASRRLDRRRKRTFSLSIFKMYDPTSVEAELSSDASSSDKEDDNVSIFHMDRSSDCRSISPSSDKTENVYRLLRQRKGPGLVQYSESDTLLKPPQVLVTGSDSVQMAEWRCSEESHLTTPNSILSKSSVQSASKKQVSLLMGPNLNLVPKGGHLIRKLSVRVNTPHTPFKEVRRCSATRLFQSEIKDSTYIDCLRKLAPGDAEYTDGDFLYDLTKLLREIMQEARNLTDAERCSVFLLDQDSDELVATVFDGITTKKQEVQAEIRLPKTQGIAGHVATTGSLLNIKDAYSHPLFYRGIDDSTGFRTRNILCFPIKDEEGVVLGVAQLCNKKTGTYFTTFDEEIASAFAVYCCISISHCLIYKKLQETQQRYKLANELMMFHMQQVPMEEVRELAVKGLPSVTVFHKNFDKFSYIPRTLPESSTPAATQAMFEDLGLITRWRLKTDTLARFILMVKKGYRNPPYHNWMHAYTVAHFAYLCIKNLKLAQYLDDIELLALFVSCLCHDIDHRGTTNSFQIKSQSVLAALYSSEGSVMERHHLAQSMCILNTEGSNIFENLTSKEYQQVLDLMKDIILATDVAHHLRIYTLLETMVKEGYKKSDPKCHNLLLCLLMTASDLSDQTKNWDNTKKIAVLIYQEFFSQGDLEKALGDNPLEMMDREKAKVPDLQISFLSNIAIPVYKLLADLFPQAKQVEKRATRNMICWVKKAEFLRKHYSLEHNLTVQQIISLGDSSSSSEDEE